MRNWETLLLLLYTVNSWVIIVIVYIVNIWVIIDDDDDGGDQSDNICRTAAQV